MATPSDGQQKRVPVISWANPVTAAGFTMIPNAVMLRTHLSAEARLVYGYMSHLAWRCQDEKITSAREAIAQDLGLSDKRVTQAIRELTEEPVVCGDDSEPSLIIRIRPGQGKPNRYIVNQPESMPFPVDRSDMLKQREARRAVANAVRRGELIREPCEVCGQTPSEGHHDDYDKPLEVRWLCLDHHREEHVESRKAERDLLEKPNGIFPPSLEDLSTREEHPLESPVADSAVSATAEAVAVEPPAIGRVDGRNLALDALMEVCRWDMDNGRRVAQAAAALNGRFHKHTGKLITQGITHLYWLEVTRFVASNPEHAERLPEIRDDPAAYSAALARAICRKGELYRLTMPHNTLLTPTALAAWWLDLEKHDRKVEGRGVTTDDIDKMDFDG